MKGAEFYKRLQPAYAKWLDSMDKADAINNAAEIAFVKEIMFLLDEFYHAMPKISDDMDPAWFLDQCINAQHCADDWYDVFNGLEYSEGLVESLNNEWRKYKDEHRGKRDDDDNH